MLFCVFKPSTGLESVHPEEHPSSPKTIYIYIYRLTEVKEIPELGSPKDILFIVDWTPCS